MVILNRSANYAHVPIINIVKKYDVLCPWARHFTPRKYLLNTQEAVAPSRHDWKIVDWDVKPQHKQTNKEIWLDCEI